MAYEASFSPEFWLAEGEPYDRSDLALDARGCPMSVYSAILVALQDKSLRSALVELLGVEDSLLFDDSMAEQLLSKAQEVNTVENLGSPVGVWLDQKGWIQVKVY